ncbi:hypothetical protein [Propionivibrio sp.]|uniref:hypothetical protein n=1 Tax=Propionivibrio sp. TaxID=2212460 RepID=UPI00262944E0|nr:hypothetical protein [Propionivibrio sp.]
MPRANDHRNTTQLRKLIASAAARLIAENGISDYALAKRKAASGLGLPENTHLPENAEIDTELQIYQRLFQDEEHNARVDYLRQKASEIMVIMHRFNPYLTGPVLDGSAGRYAEIDIQLFTDNAKDVEIFMLNQHFDYEHSVPRSPRAEAVLTIHDEDAVVNLIVYPAREERIMFKTRDGKIRQHARLDAVNRLLNSPGTDIP